MIFSKEEQRRRAAEFEAAQKAKGVSAPPPQPIVLTKSAPVTQHQTPIGQYSVKPSVSFSKSVVDFSNLKPSKVFKKTYVEESMTNHLGQVVNPGDSVILITQGYNHATRVTLGTYLGARYSSNSSKPSSWAVLVQRKGYDSKTKTRGLKWVRTTSYAGMIYPTR